MKLEELIYLLNSELESDRQIGYAILDNLKQTYDKQKKGRETDETNKRAAQANSEN